MLNFKPITPSDANKLRRYYETCNYGLCEYAVGTKMMWRTVLHPEWTEANGCLVVRNHLDDGRYLFDYPVAGPEGDEEAALETIENDCIQKGIRLIISIVPDSEAPVLLSRYPYVKVHNIRTWRDYIYRTEDLQEFAGKKYAGQRNHVRRFRSQHPDAFFRPLTPEDLPAVETFWGEFEKEFPKMNNKKAVNELSYSKRVFRMIKKPYLHAGGIFEGDRLCALALGERCGETLIIHIEKALYSYEGIYPTLVQEFALAFAGTAKYINREDDASNRGLRTSKLQYNPIKLAPKYYFEPQNELLCNVKEVPTLKTQRLTLSAITCADKKAYNELILDADRNRFWGYDDVGGVDGNIDENTFVSIAHRDFDNCTAVNFAIRLDDIFIGEAVLYNFNYRGDAELGCRIAKDYGGNGYGTEAFAAVADWALYQVDLNRVVAKCYKENAASFKMLSAVMKKTGEDETFFYFEKLV